MLSSKIPEVREELLVLRAELDLRQEVHAAYLQHDEEKLRAAIATAVEAGVDPEHSVVLQRALDLQQQFGRESTVRQHVARLEAATNDFLDSSSNADTEADQGTPSKDHLLSDFAAIVQAVGDLAQDDGSLDDDFLAQLLGHCRELVAAEEARRGLDRARADFTKKINELEAQSDFEGIESAVETAEKSADAAGFRDLIIRARRTARALRGAEQLLHMIAKIDDIAAAIPALTDATSLRNHRESLEGYADAASDLGLPHDHELVKRIRVAFEICDGRLQHVLAAQALGRAVELAENSRNADELHRAVLVAREYLSEGDPQLNLALNLLAELRDEPAVAELVNRLRSHIDDIDELEKVIGEFDGEQGATCVFFVLSFVQQALVPNNVVGCACSYCHDVCL